MSTARWSHTATLLLDGRVLVAGGLFDVVTDLAWMPSAEVYDPTSNSWAKVQSMKTALLPRVCSPQSEKSWLRK